MATIAPTLRPIGNGRLEATWVLVANGDVGAPANFGHRSDLNVTVEGTITTFAFEGSNDQGFANPRTLEDTDGTAVTAAGIYTVKESPKLVRPKLTTGANVTVIAVAG